MFQTLDSLSPSQVFAVENDERGQKFIMRGRGIVGLKWCFLSK